MQKKTAKISTEEYWFLRGLDDGRKWLARDKDTDLWVFGKYPIKHEDFWDEYSGVCEIVDSDLFQFIQWENEYPYSISELIEEYEKESEETEVKKDKKRLLEKLTRERNETDVHDPAYQYLSEFIEEVNQLDEPEVLSQEFIDEKAVEVYVDTADAEVHVVFRMEDLQNLLVPKQELPVIPNHVADWMEQYNEYGFDLYPALKKLEINELIWEDVYEWYRKNTREFVNAYLTGLYEVEEEQKFYVDLNTAAYVAKWDGDGSVRLYTDSISGSDEYELHLTEREIKDYDERFWPFRKPVEETE